MTRSLPPLAALACVLAVAGCPGPNQPGPAGTPKPTATKGVDAVPSPKPTATGPGATPTPGGATPTPGPTGTTPTPGGPATGAPTTAPTTAMPGPAGSACLVTPYPSPTSDAPDPTPPQATLTPTPVPVTAGAPVQLEGKVYDEAGALVTGATVSIKSLNAATPFTTSATATSGAYVLANVPTGVILEITATKAGFTTRRRTLTAATGATPPAVDFGAAGADVAAVGAPYFISDHPEVESVQYVTNLGETPRPDSLAFKLVLSEPLDQANQQRLMAAIRVWPADSFAAGGTVVLDAVGKPDTAIDGGDPTAIDDLDVRTGQPQVPYVAKQGSNDLDGSTASVLAGDGGKTFTFTLRSKALAGKDAGAKYQIGLVAPDGQKIAADGKQLGTDRLGAFTAYPAAAAGAAPLIRNVFRARDLSLAGTSGSPEGRWAATHETVARWETTQDYLGLNFNLSAVVDDDGGHTRLTFDFVRPIVAFNDTEIGFASESILGRRGPLAAAKDFNGTPAGTFQAGQLAQVGADDLTPAYDLLDNFTFALGALKDDTKDVKLDGARGVMDAIVDAVAGDVSDAGCGTFAPHKDPFDKPDPGTFGGHLFDRKKEFRFRASNLSFATGVATGVADPRVAQAAPGTIFLAVDPTHHSRLHLWILKRPGFFPPIVKEIKASARRVANPNGLAISEWRANREPSTFNR